MNTDELSEHLDPDTRAALDRVQDSLTTTRERVQDGLNAARSRVQDGLEKAKGRVQDGYQTARDRSTDAVQGGVRYVRANPIPVIAGALVVGAVLGYLFMRRSDEDLSLRERYQLDDRVKGARGWLKDQLTPVAEAAQRHVRTAGDALDDARQKVAELDVKHYIDPLVERTKRASSRFNFWQ